MRRIGLAWVLAFGLVAGTADAEDEASLRCMASYEQGQKLQRESKLSAARVQLRVCADTCPSVFAQDCNRWLREVDALAPTVRLGAQDASGHPIKGARVLVDGQLLGDPVPDGPIALDVGNRVFRFEREGYAPVEVTVALAASERDHPVAVTLTALRTAAVAVPVVTRPSAAPSFVFGAVGGLALVAAGVLTIKGHVDRSNLLSTCSPTCKPDAADPIRSEWLVAGVLAGVGALAIGTAIVLWPKTRHTTTLSWSVGSRGIAVGGELF